MSTRRLTLAALLALAFLAAAAVPASAEYYFVYPDSGRLSQVYWTPVTYTTSGYHKGLDIVAPSGVPIVAARGGTVSFAAWSTVGYGNLVILNHESSYQTYYGHNSSFVAHQGDVVAVNQTIALEGTTGNSTGPHCHWEIRRYGTPIYLPGKVYDTVTRSTPLNYFYADLTSLDGGTPPPPPPPSTTQAVKVTASSLNVRSGAGTGYSIIGTVYANQIYVSPQQSNGWYQIYYAGNTGWCSGGYLTRVTGVTVRKVTTSSLNVRTGPGTGYSIVGTAHLNEMYYNWTSSSGWYGIYFGGSSSRWFSGAYVTAVGL